MEGNHAQHWMRKGEEMVCRECYSQIHFMLTNIDGELCSCSFPVDRRGRGGLFIPRANRMADSILPRWDYHQCYADKGTLRDKCGYAAGPLCCDGSDLSLPWPLPLEEQRVIPSVFPIKFCQCLIKEETCRSFHFLELWKSQSVSWAQHTTDSSDIGQDCGNISSCF